MDLRDGQSQIAEVQELLVRAGDLLGKLANGLGFEEIPAGFDEVVPMTESSVRWQVAGVAQSVSLEVYVLSSKLNRAAQLNIEELQRDWFLNTEEKVQA